MFYYAKNRFLLEQMNSSGNSLDYERRNLQIAIIDDMEVPYLDSLRSAGYNVTHYKDIDNFEMIKPYPIVICDIMGVGKKFGSDKEGAYVIGEIRDLYPDKYIIAMSSVVYKVSWVKALEVADDKIIRDADVDKVFSALTIAVNVMKSNKLRWIRVRKQLLEKHNLDLFDVWKIEQQLIASFVSKDKEKFTDSKVVNHAGDIVKGLLVNFVSGMVF